MSKITILTSPNFPATKRVSADGAKSAGPKPLFFYFEERTVESIFDLAALLLQLEREKYSRVIRGEPTRDAIPGRPVARTSNVQPDGTPPMFRAVDRPYAMIDVDKLEIPKSILPTSLDAVEYIIRQLPSEFHEVTTFYQFSSSAGLREQSISLHLWYWLDKPVSDKSLREWARDYNARYGRKLGSVDKLDSQIT